MLKCSNVKMEKGFTLIEVLVIIGIVIILMAITILNYRFFLKETDLDQSTEEIINILRLAQNKTLASEGASQYGVYFDRAVSPNQYTLFKGTSYALRETAFDRVYELPKEIEIYEINLDGGYEVIFNRIIGDTSQAGNLSLRLIDNPSKTITIYVANSGKITLNNPPPPTNGRIVDSRHVHFDLGWSIKDATTLKFYFPDILPPETKEVTMADYFDGLKTEFDWTGTFEIQGIDQIFQVHTHSLDVFDTLLCIHRDRTQGRTNQEVIIYIVHEGIDKEIAHYEADAGDTVNKGSSVINEMKVQ